MLAHLKTLASNLRHLSIGPSSDDSVEASFIKFQSLTTEKDSMWIKKEFFLVTVVPHVEMKYFTNHTPSLLFLMPSSAIFISIFILPILLSSFPANICSFLFSIHPTVPWDFTLIEGSFIFFSFFPSTELHIKTVQLLLKMVSRLSFCFPPVHFAGKRCRLPTPENACSPSSHGFIFANHMLSINQQCAGQTNMTNN